MRRQASPGLEPQQRQAGGAFFVAESAVQLLIEASLENQCQNKIIHQFDRPCTTRPNGLPFPRFYPSSGSVLRAGLGMSLVLLNNFQALAFLAVARKSRAPRFRIERCVNARKLFTGSERASHRNHHPKVVRLQGGNDQLQRDW